ncbi:MAG: hypothetical protein EOQ99_18310 [Mesorhizobium sp.]|nr:MAG: hypothetical protein EOQ99_18310 [Mesorhizobium sp.]
MHDKIASLIQGGMDRRLFLKAAAATAIASAFPRAGLAETPRKGGVLRLGLNGGSSADTLDPTQLIGTFSINVSRQVYNTLVEISDDGKPAPELAASWEASDGNKLWILNLRPGVQFHNGKAFDAEDVKYSLGLHIGEKGQGAGRRHFRSARRLADAGRDSPEVTQFRYGLCAVRSPLRHGAGGLRRLDQACRHRPVQADGLSTRRSGDCCAQRGLLEKRSRPCRFRRDDRDQRPDGPRLGAAGRLGPCHQWRRLQDRSAAQEGPSLLSGGH